MLPIADTTASGASPSDLARSLLAPRRRTRGLVVRAGVAMGIGAACAVAVSVALVGGPRRPRCDERAQLAAARELVQRYALDAFPRWVMNHPDAACPAQLADLDALAARTHSIDPWGTPLHGGCVGALYRVQSAGPDRRFGTTDDIVEGP